MEFLEGEDLRDHLSRVGLLPLGQALAILAPTLAAVGVAHRRGIIHRDLKPENIFLSESGGAQVVKVLDFGIARAVTANWGTMAERLTGTGMACGTPHYMAPEQLRGADDLGPPADVYSLGCVLFELLTGQPPFDGKSPVDIALKHVDRPPPPLLEEYAGTHIEYVVYRALAKNATARFPDANAMLEELKRCVEYQDPDAGAHGGEAVDWARVTLRVPEGTPCPWPPSAHAWSCPPTPGCPRLPSRPSPTPIPPPAPAPWTA
jgi:serine/threonine protein kinase